jgi:hypothetical protein
MKMRAMAFAMCLPMMAGCSFLKAKSDPTRYYVLTSERTSAPVIASPITVGIDHVELPDYLNRSELVTRSASNQLTIADYERWGEPLKEGFARTFRHDLESDLGAGRVVSAPFDPAARPSFSVDVDVRRFEPVGNDAALLEAHWTVRDGTSASVVASGDARIRAPAAGANAAAAVAALSSAVASLGRDVAAAVRAHVERRAVR